MSTRSSGVPRQDLPLLLAAGWLALAFGLLEAGIRLIQQQAFGKILLLGPHVLWMAPTVNLVELGGLALVLVILGRRWPVLAGPKVGHPLLGTLAILPLLLLYTPLHDWVALLLSLGIALRASHLIAARQVPAGRVVRRSLPWMAAAVLLAGPVIGGWRWWSERRALAAVPPADASSPNLLLIIWDTVREQNLSAYGYHRPTTPRLERLAGDGVRFESAYATAPWTLPSHASMFTGRYPGEMSATLYQALDDTWPVLAGVLRDHGYATGGFVANMSYGTREHGLNRGFSHYEDFRITPGTVLWTSRIGRVVLEDGTVRRAIGLQELLWRKPASVVTRDFLKWVRGLEGRPFFAFLNYFDAHQPYLPPEPFRSRFETAAPAGAFSRRVTAAFEDMTPAEIRWSESRYDGTIAAMDDQIGHLLAGLDSAGLRERTIVIVTSDHGEHFGDHDRISHGNSLYRQLIEVPLVVSYPAAIPAGQTVSTPVSLRDLAATALDLLGIVDSAPFPGRTLARFWSDEQTPEPTTVVSEMPAAGGKGAWSLVAWGYHFIHWWRMPPQLYQLAADPLEERNLADSAGAQPLMASFRALADSLGKPTVPPAAGPRADSLPQPATAEGS
ncbi:MAG: sulfatase [Gemmatimonadales bacterium]